MEDKCDGCKPAIRIESIIERLDKFELEMKDSQVRQGERIGIVERTMGKYEERTDNMIGSMKEIKDNMTLANDEIKALIKDLSKKIDEIESKPARNYEEMIKAGIGAIVVALITYFLAKK